MAKKTTAGAAQNPADYSDDGTRKTTSVKIFTDTYRKLRTLGSLRDKNMHEMLEELMAERLDHELLEESRKLTAGLEEPSEK